MFYTNRLEAPRLCGLDVAKQHTHSSERGGRGRLATAAAHDRSLRATGGLDGQKPQEKVIEPGTKLQATRRANSP